MFNSLRFQILLIALLPIVLIDTLLTIRHIDTSITQAEALLQSNGEIVAWQVANAAEFYLYSGEFDKIQRLLDQTIGSNDIVYAAIYDDRGKTIAESVGSEFTAGTTSDYLYYRHPVRTQTLDADDVFNPDQTTDSTATRTLGWVHIYLTREHLREKQLAVIKEGFLYFLVSLALALLLTLLVSRRVTRPLFALLGHIRKIEGGDLSKVIHPIESNEIGYLQRGFNSMTQALASHRSQLDQNIKHATVELKHAITDLEYKNRELEAARDEAQRADKTKGQFLANISHEIRTPINGIAGFANLLLRSGLNPNQQRYADVIAQSTTDLSDIINEVLDFSKLESDKVEISQTQFDLHNLVESARDGLFAEAMAKKIDLFLSIYSDTPRLVIGDPLRLKQILVNLLGNAIKFTDKGFVDLTVHIDDLVDDRVSVWFKVRDSGIGISKQDQKQLFKAFRQIESEPNRRFAGTGLGLVISKNLAVLMGGDIEIDSVSGFGSLFSMKLPFQPVSEPVSESDQGLPLTGLLVASDNNALNEIQSLFDRAGFDSEGLLVRNKDDVDTLRLSIRQNRGYLDFIAVDCRHNPFTASELFDDGVIESKRIILMHYDIDRIRFDTAGFEFISLINTSQDVRQMILQATSPLRDVQSSEQAESSPAHSVLIVDDNRINLMLAAELTRNWGHQPFEARNAQEALDLFDSREFDLILLDIQMPEIDGVELMLTMRQRKPDLATPIVATTANLLEAERQRLLDAGFDDFCAKPLRESRLRALIERRQPPAYSDDVLLPTPSEGKPLSIDLDLTLKLSSQNRMLSNELFTLLQEEIPQYIAQIEQALESGRNEPLHQAIHKIQGVTRCAGLPILKKLLDEFASAWQIDPSRITTLIGQIVDELKNIQHQIPELLD
jgi:two-component system sensor histidine kinase BarA